MSLSLSPSLPPTSDLRARLELAVSSLLTALEGGDEEEAQLVQLVRRRLAPALRDLMQHGLMHVSGNELNPGSCIELHSTAYELIFPIQFSWG